MTCTRPRVTISLTGKPATGRPSKATAPVIRPPRLRKMPERLSSSVLLPAAFAPTTATISPAATSRLTSRRMWTSPYQAFTLAASSKGEIFPEVGVDHPAVLHDVGRRPLGDLFPVVQDDDPLGDAHDHGHHVLDHEKRHPLGVQGLQKADHAVDLGRVEPAEHLVEAHHPRLPRHRPPHPHP